MPITIWTGRPGACKTSKLAEIHLEILARNAKWYKKTGIRRKIATNTKLHIDIEIRYKGFIEYWEDRDQLIRFQDCDIFIQEINNYFDASQWKETSLSTKRWLAQHRHLGIEIYGDCQDFSQADIAFRRVTDRLYYMVKLIGSGVPSPTKPPIKYIWGVSMIYTMSPVDYKENQKDNTTRWDGIFIQRRWKTAIFNTRQKIEPGEWPKYKHVVRQCEDPKCDYKRELHI